ncbi:MAG: GTP pyrophosphokinase family protein [Bacillus sp. (in: Bacteria)]|nr:GTP pyrophosphokinase family protein [Bacillus sp. (in: firmicutes)]MCM1427010.1 (p)ppGpp synthetase [Eubacterium sp.]
MKEEFTQEEYDRLIKPYSEALTIIQIRLDSLNAEYRSRSREYPIHNIQQRIKSKNSIIKKLEKKNMPLTASAARDELRDIAGIRIICYFEDDIYSVVAAIRKQSGILVIRERDYVKKPKENGYKSYHIVVGVPIYTLEETQYYPVEVQIRTISMDFWASMEHRICYKSGQNREVSEETRETLKSYAQQLKEIEVSMYEQSMKG